MFGVSAPDTSLIHFNLGGPSFLLGPLFLYRRALMHGLPQDVALRNRKQVRCTHLGRLRRLRNWSWGDPWWTEGTWGRQFSRGLPSPF